jgi:hypothetical protein
VQAESHSSSELLTELLEGADVRGTVFGRHELLFGDYIVVLTPPGSARMPNGIECRLTAQAGARASIGAGRLAVGRVEITPGRAWNPVPVFDPFPCLPPGPEPTAGSYGRRAEAADPASGSVLAGYVAGLVLLHGLRRRAQQVATRAIPALGPAGATLLRHGALGEVPEPVHALLASRNTSPVISSSPFGIAWLRGLVSAGLPLDLLTAQVAAGRRKA